MRGGPLWFETSEGDVIAVVPGRAGYPKRPHSFLLPQQVGLERVLSHPTCTGGWFLRSQGGGRGDGRGSALTRGEQVPWAKAS